MGALNSFSAGQQIPALAVISPSDVRQGMKIWGFQEHPHGLMRLLDQPYISEEGARPSDQDDCVYLGVGFGDADSDGLVLIELPTSS